MLFFDQKLSKIETFLNDLIPKKGKKTQKNASKSNYAQTAIILNNLATKRGAGGASSCSRSIQRVKWRNLTLWVEGQKLNDFVRHI